VSLRKGSANEGQLLGRRLPSPGYFIASVLANITAAPEASEL
jgi:hypothetical protein